MVDFRKSAKKFKKRMSFGKTEKGGVDLFDHRPVDVYAGTMDLGQVAEFPVLASNYKFCYNLYYYSDILRTIVRTLVTETIRNGIDVVPRFICKCKKCGAEYDENRKECEFCGGEIRKPDHKEKQELEKWSHKINTNYQNLEEVAESLLTDWNVIDNNYLVALKRYVWGEDGELKRAYLKEILRGSMMHLRMIINKNGKLGMNDEGQFIMVCLQHRDTPKYMTKKEVEEEPKCPICGKKLFPAHFFMARGRHQYEMHMPAGEKDKYIYYAAGEIRHSKKFTSTLAYGFPPVMSIWMKIMTLMKMDYFVLTSYHLQRSPKGLLVLRGNRQSMSKAWNKLVEFARLNPNMIHPLVVEGMAETAGSKKVAEYIDFSVKSDEINFIEYRKELRTAMGMMYGVEPIFQGDVSVGEGLSNQGLQVTVTNRAIATEQRRLNKILQWIADQWGAFDYTFKCAPHEEKDMQAQEQRELMRIRKAKGMMELGFMPEMKQTSDGIDFNFRQMTDEEKQKYMGGGGGDHEDMGMTPSDEESDDSILNDDQSQEGQPNMGGARTSGRRGEGEPEIPRQNR